MIYVFFIMVKLFGSGELFGSVCGLSIIVIGGSGVYYDVSLL